MRPRSQILGNSRVSNPRTALGFEMVDVRTHDGMLNCAFGRDEGGWEHVSASPAGSKREKDQACPTREQMCEVKRIFFYDAEMVVQIHPAEADYFHGPGFDTNILHLWRPCYGEWSKLEDKEEV